jgi:hypothetical protein
MRRFTAGVALAVVAATAACTKVRPASAGCTTSIELRKVGNGIEIGEPPKLVCAPGEQLNVSFNNQDNGNHKFEIALASCKNAKNGGRNPVDDFVGKPIDVPPGQSKKLSGGWWIFSWTPTMRSSDDIKALACSNVPSTAYVYSYTIRANGAPDKDPDLEVSPPPGMQ